MGFKCGQGSEAAGRQETENQLPGAVAPGKGQDGLGWVHETQPRAQHPCALPCELGRPALCSSAPQNHFNLVMAHLPEGRSAVEIISFFLPFSSGNYAQ